MKADGVFSSIIPVDTFPSSLKIKNYKIKSEFIEELDLYLVFDIDIPGMNIIDRYNYLREIHNYTKHTNLNKISSFEDLFFEMKKECNIFNNFLKKDYDNYRWYPKASWIVENLNDNFRKKLISNIILEKESEYICDGFKYKCDGLILVPLNGSREIKIKPKSLMTIDILYKDNNWYDRDKNIYNDIIKSEIDLKDNNIYRCYPINDYFLAKELRLDKNKPNPYNVISTIIQLYNNDWNFNIIKNTYYSNIFKPKKFMNNVISFHEYFLKEVIKFMKPLLSGNWIDFGCGYGKLFKIIKNYNPLSYFGIDNDINVLINCIRKFGKKLNHSYKFFPSKLDSNWNSHPQNWYKIKFDKKFDYMVCNFSLMHFCNDIFWKQVSMLSKSGSMMIFNLVNYKAIYKFKNNLSYLYLDNDKVKYYFEGIHLKEVEEEFISEEKINYYLQKYNWKIIKKFDVTKDFNRNNFEIKNNSLELYYDWYLIKHN